MSFENWWNEMKSNQLWFMRTQEMFGKKNLNQIASEVHLYLIAKDQFKAEDWPGWRVLFQSFARKAPDVTTVHLQQEEISPSYKEPDKPPLTGEARARRLKEYLDAIQSAPMLKPVAKPSSREIIENGQWRPKPPTIREPTEEEKLEVAQAYARKMRTARTKLFREKYPDGTVKQLREYLKKWSHFDNPNNVTF